MPGIWRFAPEQYEYVGQDNENISATYPKWIDIFGWGTGSNPTLTDASDYEYLNFVDWGTNAVSNGGNSMNIWHTLTNAEWSYIFYFRPDAESKCSIGNVNGLVGLIILPDNWSLPIGCSFNCGFSEDYDDWSHNIYTIAKWTDMEAAGAVFLPCSGDRFETDYCSDDGSYMSSGRYSDTGVDGDTGCIHFSAAGVQISGNPNNIAFAVRLVQNMN